MNETASNNEDFSLLRLGTAIVRSRWRILRWAIAGAAIAAISALSQPILYSATASFIPQGYDANRSGLAGLAGQFGVSLPSGNPSLSPEFYTNLLGSRVLLEPVVMDTLVVAEMGGKKMSFLDLFGITGGTPQSRREEGVKKLAGIIGVSVAKSTGLVQLSVRTEWRSVSLAITSALVDALNDYNQRTRQGQAAAERRFIEGRLAVANTELRQAEDRLASFLKDNRQYAGSSELSFEKDRLQRDVTLRQQVFTSLTQAYEDVRIREVRDTPVITMFEMPSASTLPDPRRRVRRVTFGLVLGAAFGLLLSIVTGPLGIRPRGGNPEAEEFFRAVGEAKADVVRGIGTLRR